MTPDGKGLAESSWRPACWVASWAPGSFEVAPDADGAPADMAAANGCRAVFEGVLFERDELRDALGGEALESHGNAELLLQAYLRWGADAFEKISGLFAAVVSDGRSGELLVARDPLGSYPLFYAETPARLELSISIEALLQRPGVPNTINRLALADHLSHRWPDVNETYFEAIRRVPAGTILRRSSAGETELQRYWDPNPPGRRIEWTTRSQLGRFDELLERAVRRRVQPGRAGIFLSGGLDSVTVAAVATDISRALGNPPPHALSLVFEHESANEEHLQRRVATALSLPNTVTRMSEALRGAGLLRSALEVCAERPAPLLSLWEPAYEQLTREARRHGCRAILTGSGGDEWLEFNPVYSADLIRGGQARLLFQVWRMMHRSYRLSRKTAARHVLWTYGLRPIVRRIALNALERMAPSCRVAHARRRIEAHTPGWVLPDPELRRNLLDRHQRLRRREQSGTHYVKEMRRALDSPIMLTEQEEMFERGRRLGIPVLHPFLDADLAAFLYTTPPQLLMLGGRTKGLIRTYLARRFPQLGFERQRKLNANEFFSETLVEEGREIWEELGGARALSALDVVDPVAVDATMQQLFTGARPKEAFRIWYVLSLETWVRARMGSLNVARPESDRLASR